MENRNRFGLDKMNDELVNDILPVEINLPKNQKNLLATLIYINGIDKKDKDGFFYVDNKYLMEVLGVSEPTIISNANKLIEEGFIQRVTGKKNHPSKYLVTDLIKKYTKEYTKDFSKYTKEYTKDFSKYTKKYTKNFSKNFSKTVENFSQDKDIDKEKDKEYIFNIINNIIKENNINLINNIKNIIKKEIENIKEKEKLSSINEKKEIETMRELNEQVNALQDENAKLTSRLDNCARQFKQMMQTNNEMLKTIKELQARVNYLESKQSSTNDKQQPSTTVEEERKDCAEKKEDTNEVISSPTASDNDTTLTTIHQEEEKPTVAQQMPLNGKELRYVDTMTDKKYSTEAEAQQDGVRPNDLYDTKVGRCLTDYTSSLSPSNDPSGIIVQDVQEKPTESEEMPLNERESFLLTVAQVFDDLRKRKYLNYQDKTDQLKEVWNYILSKEDILEQSDLEVCQKECLRIA